MRTSKSQSEAQILEDYRVALENVIGQPIIATAMAEFGYDSTMIDQGKLLLENTRVAYNLNKQEDDETNSVRALFNEKFDEAFGKYALDRKKAKVIFRKDDVTLDKLGLKGNSPRTYIKKMEAMKTFYNAAQSDPEIIQQLIRLKISAEDITSCIAAITNLEGLRSGYVREIGESQDATKAKDAAFAIMEDWMFEFYAVAKIALTDKPQLLEVLGLLVRS